jgi:hypothetical protein
MHGFHNALVAGVRCIVLQQVILGNGPDVAFQARRQRAVLPQAKDTCCVRGPKDDGAGQLSAVPLALLWRGIQMLL